MLEIGDAESRSSDDNLYAPAPILVVQRSCYPPELHADASPKFSVEGRVGPDSGNRGGGAALSLNFQQAARIFRCRRTEASSAAALHGPETGVPENFLIS